MQVQANAHPLQRCQEALQAAMTIGKCALVSAAAAMIASTTHSILACRPHPSTDDDGLWEHVTLFTSRKAALCFYKYPTLISDAYQHWVVTTAIVGLTAAILGAYSAASSLRGTRHIKQQ